MQVPKLRDFDYTNDRLIIADMDKRSNSYIIVMQKKLNDIVGALNELTTKVGEIEKTLENSVEKSEKEAADVIKYGDGESKDNLREVKR